MNRRNLSKLMLVAAALLAITACPNPITNAVLRQMTDKTAPGLTIISPADNTEYTQTVTIQGQIAYTPGELRSVSYLVAGTLGILEQGTVALSSIGSDGAFSFQFDTVTFNGPIFITVFVRDWNDNTAQKSITLLYPGSSVSSFVASPSSKSVNLSWEAVAGATGYTIYYTTNGTLPSETYGTPINTSGTAYALSGLRNGAMHIFLLRARMAAGPDFWSGYVRAIPLSELTLAPLMRGGYREISLEWSRIEATEEFEVLRSTSEAGPYVNCSGVLHGFSFTDTNVSEDTWYYYKVRPSLEGSIVSTFNGAQTVQLATASGRIASLTLPYAAQHVRYSGNYAYVAAGANGLLVVDISNPANPSLVSSSLDTTNAKDLAIQASYLYIADGSGGIRVVGVTSPPSPTLLATYTGAPSHTIADASGLAIDATRNQLYVIDAAGSTNLHVLDISNPLNISWVDDYRTRYPASTLSLLDVEVSYIDSTYTMVYVTAENTSGHEFEEFRYDNSGGPQKIYESRTFTDANYDPNIVVLSGNYAYVMATRNVDIEPPPEYALIVLSTSTFTEVGRTTEVSGWVTDIRVSGTKAYIVDGIGIQEYDVSAPATPAIGERLDTLGTPTGIDTNGSYAFLASGLPVFQVVDLRLPGSMSIAGSDSSSGLIGLAVRGDYVYAAATGTPRLQVINISNPTAPSSSGMGSYNISGARDVALSGPYAFVACGTGGLTVVNISNPVSLSFLGSSAPLSGYLYRLAVKGDYVYAAASTSLQVYDVSNPALPVGVGIYDSDGGGMRDVEIHGETAYTTDGTMYQPNSLKLLDVSNPAIPTLSGKGLDSGMEVGHLSLYGDWAFVSDEYPGQGLWAVNINPGSASYLTAYGPCDTLPGGDGFGTAGVAALGGTAYVLDPGGGLVLVDISNPVSLSDSSLGSSLALGTSPSEVILNGKYALATDSATGLRIIRLIP